MPITYGFWFVGRFLWGGILFELGEIRKFQRLVDGKLETSKGQIVGRTYEAEGSRHYDFKVGDHIVIGIKEENIHGR